jgi:hypothetical protein
MKTQIIILLLAILLASCVPVPTRAPTNTPTPQPTETSTPEPTRTPEPLVLGAVNPYLVGIGEHGAMVCVKLDNQQQIEGLVIKANISQTGKILDRDVISEKTETNGTCFEILDAKYIPGQPVSIEINAISPGIRIKDGTQITNLGEYGVINPDGNWDHYPFLKYIYPDELGLQIVELYRYGNVNDGFHPAIDFTPFVSSTYKTLKDVPVSSPVSGKVFQVGMDNPDQTGWQRVNNIIVESQYTGWLITLGHLAYQTPGNGLLTDYCSGSGSNNTWTNCTKTFFHAGQHIGFINVSPLDPWAGVPHIHITVTNPAGQGVYTEGDLNNIDPTYLWLAPPDIPGLIKAAPTIYK